MIIIEYILILIALFATCIWLSEVRRAYKYGDWVTDQTCITIFLWIIILGYIVIFDESKLHLLWSYPLSIIIGMLSVYFPLSLLKIFANIIRKLSCIGLKQ